MRGRGGGSQGAAVAGGEVAGVTAENHDLSVRTDDGIIINSIGPADAIGRELSFSDSELADLVFAAQVHDIGKIIIPERLLNKAGSLTFDEFQLVKSHAAVGAEIIAAIPGADNAQIVGSTTGLTTIGGGVSGAAVEHNKSVAGITIGSGGASNVSIRDNAIIATASKSRSAQGAR